jgi:hypothetical protein
MEKRFRVSAIGRIRPGVDYDDVKSVVASKLAEKGLPTANLRWIRVPSRNGKRLYAKFWAVIPANELDDAWNIGASRAFSDAGYGDLTWKITPVTADDSDGENTTCSIPENFIQGWFKAQARGDRSRSAMMPESSGAEGFREWCDDQDE